MTFVGSLDDTVTILNPVAATIGAMIKDHPFWQPGLNGFLLAIKEKLFVTAPVGKIIFDGYNDPLFDNLEKMIHDAGPNFATHRGMTKTWPAQAKLAELGEWDELAKWQEVLKGGV